MLDTTQLGERIRTYRLQNGLTQSALAEKLYVSFQAISSWECGNTLPDIENLCQLSSIFGVSLDTMLRKKMVIDEEAVISIHGGGTTTEFVIVTQSGRILKQMSSPGTNASFIGVEAALSIFSHGIDLCLAEVSKLRGVFLGATGGSVEEIVALLSKRYPSLAIHRSSVGCNLFSCAEGDVVLICDAGSGLVKKEKGGEIYRGLGGWGHVFGDPGSAYNLGREAIRIAMAYEDGIGGSSMVCSAFKKKLGVRMVRGAFKNASVAQIARQADVLLEAYLANDPEAERVLHEEMKALGGLIRAACKDGKRVIVSGNLMEEYHHLLLPILQQYVDEGVQFILPELPLVYGTCIEACRSFGLDPCEDFAEHFLLDYRMMGSFS